MTDEPNMDESELPAAAPIASEQFEQFMTLLALIIDPKACGARLRSLQAAQAAALAAEAQLAEARHAYDVAVAKERAELQAEREQLPSGGLRSRQSKDKAMSQDVKPTRRAILAGAAALPATAAVAAMPLAVVDRDPIFAAIDPHRAASASYDDNCSRLDEEDTPEAEAQLSELHNREESAALAILAVEPTTIAGVVAILTYAADQSFAHRDWPTGLRDENHESGIGFPWEAFLHENLARALSKIAAASGRVS
jgi:hypothetical protein